MDEKPIDILLVEDSASDAGAIQRQLSRGRREGLTLRVKGTLESGIAEARSAAPDVILLDLNLPDSDGLETVKAMGAGCPEIPVVVLTGLDDDATGLAAVNLGAEDYLVKGEVDPGRLARILRFSVERHRALAALRGLSTLDELTGIHNRRGFLALAARHFAKSRPPTPSCAMYFIDIDGLKVINDTFGHTEGDAAIAGAAGVLKQVFKPADVIGRLGGDEFAALRLEPGLGPPQDVLARIRDGVEKFNAAMPRPWKLSLSVGCARLSDEATTLEDMLVQADRRMYAAKGEKKRP